MCKCNMSIVVPLTQSEQIVNIEMPVGAQSIQSYVFLNSIFPTCCDTGTFL